MLPRAASAELSVLGLEDLDERLRRLETSVSDLRSLHQNRPSPGADDSPSRNDAAEALRRLDAVESRIAGVEALTARVHDVERTVEQVSASQLPALSERLAHLESRPESTFPAAEVAIAAARSVLPMPRAESDSVPRSSDAPNPASSPWLLFDLWGRFSLLFRMFCDRRFRMTWQSRILLAVAVTLFLTSEFWFPLSWILIVGGWIDKAAKLLLAFAAYVALSREIARYKDELARRRFG